MNDGARRASRLPYLTGTVGALLIAFSSIFVSLAAVAPSTAAVWRCLYALPALGLLALRERRRGDRRSRRDRLMALGAGAFFAVDLTFWHYTIDAVGAGLATVLANTQVVMVGLVAWLVLAERPSRRALMAVPVVLAGVVLISGVLGQGAYGANPGLGVLFGLIAAAGYCGFLLLLRSSNTGGEDGPAGSLFDATACAALVAAAGGLATGDLDLVPVWPAHGWLVTLALSSQVVAWLLISVSLPRLPALVTSILLMLQPVGSVFLGVVLLGESPSPVQFAGVGLVLAGIAVATLGGAGNDRGGGNGGSQQRGDEERDALTGRAGR